MDISTQLEDLQTRLRNAEAEIQSLKGLGIKAQKTWMDTGKAAKKLGLSTTTIRNLIDNAVNFQNSMVAEDHYRIIRGQYRNRYYVDLDRFQDFLKRATLEGY
jgi:hypothetical protein